MNLNNKAKEEIITILLEHEEKQQKAMHRYQKWTCFKMGLAYAALCVLAALIGGLLALIVR